MDTHLDVSDFFPNVDEEINIFTKGENEMQKFMFMFNKVYFTFHFFFIYYMQIKLMNKNSLFNLFLNSFILKGKMTDTMICKKDPCLVDNETIASW